MESTKVLNYFNICGRRCQISAIRFVISGAGRYDFRTLAVARMSILPSRLAFALVMAALCLGGRTAHAQAAPVTYWSPGWPVGFGGLTAGQGSNTYGNFPGFDGSDARGGGFSSTRYNFSNGWFVGGEGGGLGLGLNGINQNAAFGSSLYYQGVQFGYNFKSSGGLPLTVYAGFDTLKYNSGIGGPFAPFDTVSGTLPGYSAHAGVEYQPTPNLSLSLGFGYTQQSGRIDSDINSLTLPGASPFAIRR
jgi:opacity protein-like surface antigen